MKKLIPITCSIAVAFSTTGCSVMRMAEFATSDMGHEEWSLIQNLLHARDVIESCNTKFDYNYDLTPLKERVRLAYTSEEEFKLWSESIRTKWVSKGECDTWSERVTAWENTGDLPLIGGSYTDPKWSNNKS
ncbi:hypothetical protein [Psychromonas sp. Urea-02u-13]|uniref:hypothetical protein n=1 Tax=Psychromonas sp. Urea-02u-13 TaxID=2058326 RepID=UPI000C33A4C4|nr:hypothetical protein [Psychromonas sp. Urea-02u-13]